MKIAVLIKQVPDTESKIRVKSDGSGIEETDVKYIVNPYCEYAIEEAIRTKEKIKAGEPEAPVATVVISLGPDRALEALRTALAMGIDKAIHIDSEGKIFDGFQTAKILAGVLKAGAFDLIFCGKQAIDDDNSQVAQMTAEFLDFPQVMIIQKFDLTPDSKGALVTRQVGGGAREIYEAVFPLILGCEKGLNTPRYASLPGIMKAKTKPVEKLKASAFLGDTGPLTQFIHYQLPPERAAGKKLDGEAPQQAHELARLLREEAKVI
ncbi:MAG: electron transfer flavoprotein subunit beta/FixA family protein [Deltaproteobacteria bacterium]|nr:electron transfer flavoprotein subunit beta/FixA family protein [Deltaproteobacteria bacterium]